jgi:hypothetical protein
MLPYCCGDAEMKERTTQLLLVLIAGLLALHLCRRSPLESTAQAQPGGQVADQIRAQTIELVDKEGRTRAQLKVESDGEAVLRLRDARGAIRVKLGASEHGAGLLLLDNETEPAAHLLVAPRSTTLTLAEKGKQKRTITP